MAYVKPETVLAPKNRVRSLEVLYNGGSNSWSAALIGWDGKEKLALRWNGKKNETGMGNPQSRGKPTWFIVPDELSGAIREAVEELAESQDGALLAGYRAMAQDEEREREAHEWSEALIGDAAGSES